MRGNIGAPLHDVARYIDRRVKAGDPAYQILRPAPPKPRPPKPRLPDHGLAGAPSAHTPWRSSARSRSRSPCIASASPRSVLPLAGQFTPLSCDSSTSGARNPKPIAEVLGLPIAYVERLLGDLARGGEPIEREFVLWVDHARGRVLPYTALSGVAVKPSRSGPFTLREDPPTPNMLEDMGLQAGLSWDMGLGRLRRGPRPHRRRPRHP